MSFKQPKSPLLTLAMLLLLPAIGSAQCPNVKIVEGEHGDTIVTCANPQITLHADAFITTQHFNGNYLVESIPYDPPEPFTAGIHLPLSIDDVWDSQGGLDIDFPFQFFGVTQTHVFMAANGLVSFNSSITAGQASGYAWDTYYPINPSPSNPSGFPWPNSILGVASDMDPAYIPASESNRRGVFKYSGGEVPCRHITVSWNEVPVFGHSSEQATYNCTHQVVLYEGTNVIEVHVKKHRSYGTASGGTKSAIGIINADGTSAFMAPGRNPFQTPINEDAPEAWRFTPQGTTVKAISWYRLTADGDSIELGANANSPAARQAEGYYSSSDHMSAVVYPTEPADYMVTVRYNGATGYFYYLTDVIHVNVDTSTSYTLTSPQSSGRGRAAACHGSRGQFNVSIPASSAYDTIVWNVTRMANGRTSTVSADHYSVGNSNATLWVEPMDAIHEGVADTFHIYSNVFFSNGCSRSDSVLYIVHPVYDIHYHEGICQNQSFEMWGEHFTLENDYMRHFRSAAGCDSVETLHLRVSETNIYIESISSCHEYTWRNGVTYYESNTGTAITDTVIERNRYGCDSVIQLNFTLLPIEARIEANPPSATIDRLNIQLSDVSVGADRREWLFPNGTVNMSQTAYYSFNTDEDSATIGLHVSNNIGCEDDTTITLHLLKENIWIPNAFTPKEETNNRFFVSCVGIVYLQMYIYDRRGELVGHFEGVDGSWDGYDTHGELCKTGSYTYVCRYADIINPNAILVKRGTITLIR
ncbi:MAG: hypothetical protein AUK63_1091 [bacterium P3]|nr:MAG: hypothetical protein AUK63_1091 [bacterium P3]KWW40645.1 MAG: hypothetical protein F083_1439 [bacterium F083]